MCGPTTPIGWFPPASSPRARRSPSTAVDGSARDGRCARGPELHPQEKARGRRDQAYAGNLCRRAVERLITATGAHGLYLENVMQRKFRDVCATNGHISGNWDLAATTYGRVMLGLDPASMFV